MLERYIILREECSQKLKRPLNNQEKRFILWIVKREVQVQGIKIAN